MLSVRQVWGTPSVHDFLSSNQPWSTYIKNGNLQLQHLQPGLPVQLSAAVKAMVIVVPHRAEFSDAVGFYVEVRKSMCKHTH